MRRTRPTLRWKNAILMSLWLGATVGGAAPPGKSPSVSNAPKATQHVSPQSASTPLDAANQGDVQSALPSPQLAEQKTIPGNPWAATARTVGSFLVVGMVPTLILLSTSFVRITIVLALLRQALGSQLILAPQILTPLALILTCGIMAPTWRKSYDVVQAHGGWEAVVSQANSWPKVMVPVRDFMSRQIDHAGNSADVWLFLDYRANPSPSPKTYDEVPLDVLLSAFVLSELKTAFLMGFQIYLPFLVVDLVVSTLLTTAGLVNLPASVVSLPLKFFLFVMADGWHMVAESLLQSFRMIGPGP